MNGRRQTPAAGAGADGDVLQRYSAMFCDTVREWLIVV